MKKLFPALVVLTLLQACTYAISPDITATADKNLTFQQLQADPDLYKGKTVILGGTIDAVKADPQGTLLEVIERPLDYWGKPNRTNQTGGRFLVLYPGSLDPAVYTADRSITVAAVVEGTRASLNADSGLTYVLLRSRQLKLWERDRQSWNKPQWFDPLYDPNGPPRRDW